MAGADRDQQAYSYLMNDVLHPGEALRWTGRPIPKLLSSRNLVSAVFGVFFFGFAVSWTLTASQGGGFFWLFGIPFLAAGAWILSKPYREFRGAHNLYYAISNHRVIMLSAGKSFEATSLYPADITTLRRTEHQDGSGDLQLRTTIVRDDDGGKTSVEFFDGLWGISDVRGAAEAVGALRRNG